MKKAVFFDRDGVLNVDKGYQFKISSFEITDIPLIEKFG